MAVRVNEHPLVFLRFLPHREPVEEKVGDLKPHPEPLRNLLLFTALLNAQPGVFRHAGHALFPFRHQFSSKTGPHPVRDRAVFPIDGVNLLNRIKRPIKVTIFKKAFQALFMVIFACGLDRGFFLFCEFNLCSCSPQDTGNIRKTRLVMIVRTSMKFSFDSAEVTCPRPLNVMLFTVSKNDFFVLIRVTPPRQNFVGIASFPALLCVRSLWSPRYLLRMALERGFLFTISCHVALLLCKCCGKPVAAAHVADKVKIVGRCGMEDRAN